MNVGLVINLYNSYQMIAVAASSNQEKQSPTKISYHNVVVQN